MFDRKKPLWQSGTLHLALIAGSVIFALPYAWLVGTSFKLDKELQTGDVRIFPQKPIPTPVSPYIDARTFDPIARPQAAPRTAWNAWRRSAT